MHSKLKGNIAQAAVSLELQKNEFNVFSEMGDYSMAYINQLGRGCGDYGTNNGDGDARSLD